MLSVGLLYMCTGGEGLARDGAATPNAAPMQVRANGHYLAQTHPSVSEHFSNARPMAMHRPTTAGGLQSPQPLQQQSSAAAAAPMASGASAAPGASTPRQQSPGSGSSALHLTLPELSACRLYEGQHGSSQALMPPVSQDLTTPWNTGGSRLLT